MTSSTVLTTLKCPNCGAKDWDVDDVGMTCRYCQGWVSITGAPQSTKAQTAKRGRERESTLKAMLAGLQAQAEAAKAYVPPLVLQSLYGQQIVKANKKANDLVFWLAAAEDDHPDRWLAEARLRYAEDTCRLLSHRGHAMFCENHPPEGVPMEHAFGLSRLGMLDTPPSLLSWARPCEVCVLTTEIEQMRRKLEASWKGGKA